MTFMTKMRHILFLWLAAFTLCVLLVTLRPESVLAQVRVSATPVSAVLPQAQPQAIQQQAMFASPTPTVTPTEDLSIGFEVKPDLGTADVRAMPDPEGERLDPIKSGTRYIITGRFYKWIRFQYDKALDGSGWVFEDLVDITGTGTIPDIDPYATPSATPAGGNIEETRAAVTLTPGAIDTLDAQARLIAVPTMATTGEVQAGVLPTYTRPAEVAPRQTQAAVSSGRPATLQETLARAATGQIPPIVPILVLGAAGLLGMIVSLWRR